MKRLSILVFILGILVWIWIGVSQLRLDSIGINRFLRLEKPASSLPSASNKPSSGFGQLLGNQQNQIPTPTPTPEPLVELPQPTSKPVVKTTTPKPATKTQTTTTPSGLPKTLRIPKIGVNASVEYVGLDADGRMDIPKQWYTVGWYQLGYKIGDNGSAVMSGHLDTSSGAPAVFWNIGKLNPGDTFSVIDTNGATFTFRVYEKQIYPYDQLPLQRIFGTAGTPGLNLITCGGSWDRNARNYSERTVIYSQIVR